MSKRIVRLILSQFAVKTLATGLALLLQLYLAFILGEDGFGKYALVIGAVTVAAIFLSGGFKTALIRFVSEKLITGDIAAARSRFTVILISLFTLACIVCTVAWVGVSNLQLAASLDMLITYGLLLVPLMVVLNVSWGALRGCKKPIQSELVESVLIPVFLIVALCVYFLKAYPLDVGEILKLQLFAIASVSVYALWVLRRNGILGRIVSGAYVEMPALMKIALPLLFFSLVLVLNSRIDIFVIGTFQSAKDVGVYSFASRLSNLVTFALVSATAVLAPLIVEYYQKQDIDELNKIMQSSIKLTSMMTLLLGIVVLVIYYVFIHFQGGYQSSENILYILLLSNIFNAFCGPVGYVLNMTGNQKQSLSISSQALILNLCLDLLLVPKYGSIGAAMGTLVSTVYWNSRMAHYSRIHLGIKATIFERRTR